MTQDEIIEMAQQAGMTPMKLFGATKFIEVWTPDLLAFAKLVAAKERKACAKLVEPTEEHRREARHYIGGEEGVELLDNHAEAIRARGTT